MGDDTPPSPPRGRESRGAVAFKLRLVGLWFVLSLRLQQVAVAFLVGGFFFVEEEFGEDAFVGHGEDGVPFGEVAICEGVYGVDVFKFFKRLDTCFFLQYCCRRCKKLSFCFNKLG